MLFFAVVGARADFQFTTIAGPPSFRWPYSVAVDRSGNIYVGGSNYVISKITPGGVVSALAGKDGVSGYADGTGASARFNFPYGLAVDGAGNVYVADTLNNAIRRITPAGEVTTFAGGATGPLLWPQGVAVDAAGYVYVTDAFNYLVRKITPAGVVSTLAGTGVSGVQDGNATVASFGWPQGIAVDSGGTVYVTDGSAIRKVTSAGTVTTLAGIPDVGGYVDGVGSSARFNYPRGVAADNAGNVYAMDTSNNSIRKITADGTVTTVAGGGGVAAPGNRDGSPTVVLFQDPFGLALDSEGSFYVADTYNYSIRKGTRAPTVSLQPASQSAVVGSPVTFSVSATNDSPLSYQWRKAGIAIVGATSSTYTIPSVAPGDAGDYSVVVSDSLNSVASANAVLVVGQTQVAPIFLVQPLSATVFPGNTVTFTTEVIGTPVPTYQWQKNGIDIPGATNKTLTLNISPLSSLDSAGIAVSTAIAGRYALVATSGAGSVSSRFARLVVLTWWPNVSTYEIKASPTEVTAGGNVNLEYEPTNIGTRNWGSNHYLSIRDSSNTFVAYSNLVGANSGESKTVNINFAAPTTPGTYLYTVQGLENGVGFFMTQTTFALTVVAPAANSITYNATNFPVTATPGSKLIFNYNVTNTGTKSWGANHYLSLHNDAGVYFAFSSLNGVAPGQSKTVSLSFTALPTPALYPYHVQALESGVEFFTAKAKLMLTVLASQPNAVVYTKTRSQDNVTPGATVSLRYSLSNAGTGTWGASHYASLRDGNGNFLAFVPLSGVAPGGRKTVNFSFVAPTTPGVYSYYVQALEDGVEFFDQQDLVTLTVLATPIPNAATYNTTDFPSTAAPGATVTFSHNVTNRGSKTWGADHYLSLREADNTFLGFVSLEGLAPGSSKTVDFSFVAPAATGIYTYHVQGLETGIEFFNESDDLVLIVQ